MNINEIESTLKRLTESTPQIKLSMLVSPEGLTLAHQGKVNDAENVAALFIELKLVCKRIANELDNGKFKEMFILSDTSSITILPISEKGILACLSSTDTNPRMIMHACWKIANELDRVM